MKKTHTHNCIRCNRCMRQKSCIWRTYSLRPKVYIYSRNVRQKLTHES